MKKEKDNVFKLPDKSKPKPALLKKLEKLAESDSFIRQLFKLVESGNTWPDALAKILLALLNAYNALAEEIFDIGTNAKFPAVHRDKRGNIIVKIRKEND